MGTLRSVSFYPEEGNLCVAETSVFIKYRWLGDESTGLTAYSYLHIYAMFRDTLKSGFVEMHFRSKWSGKTATPGI